LRVDNKNSRTNGGTFLSARLPLLMVLICFPGSVCHQQVQSQQESLAPLEIRLAEPLRWENGCLAVKFARINRASGPLFLTKMGPYFDIALDVSKDDSQTGDDLEWVNIYGVNDILDTRSDSVAPGSSVHNNFCFGPTVWVTNIHRRTRREIAVRGKVRIEVSYFLNEKDARSYEKNEEQGPLGRTRQWARIFVDIPCPKTSCESECDKPPIGIHGERRVVPDSGQFIPEWNVRGKVLTDELTRKFPSCSVDNHR
jgi:hypothetical protein